MPILQILTSYKFWI